MFPSIIKTKWFELTVNRYEGGNFWPLIECWRNASVGWRGCKINDPQLSHIDFSAFSVSVKLWIYA